MMQRTNNKYNNKILT